jgi:hypothetical protein
VTLDAKTTVTTEVRLAQSKADDQSGAYEFEGVLLAIYPDRVMAYRTPAGTILRFDGSTSRLSVMTAFEQDLRDLLPSDLFRAAMDALGMRVTTEPNN